LDGFWLLFISYCAETAISLAALYYALKFFRKSARFIQASSNLLGVSLLNTLLLPSISASYKLIVCLYAGWIIMLKLHILEHSFNISKYRAIFLLLAMIGVQLLTITVLVKVLMVFMPGISLEAFK
jgi:hypothetical protein